MISKEDKKKIASWNQKLKNNISMDLILTQDDRSKTFREFFDLLMLTAPIIKIKQKTEESSKPPVFKIGNIKYHAIPMAQELEPFLIALEKDDGLFQNLSLSVQNKLRQICIPILLKIYILPHCPFCPAIVKQFLSLAAANEFAELTVIDGALFPEMAKSDNIHSAPTVLLDDRFSWSGSVPIEEVLDMILNRDPSQLSTSSLKAMFEKGGAHEVAKMMLDSEKIFPAFMDLLVHKKWPVRLPAMVVFETIVEQNSRLTDQVLPFLWDAFHQSEDTVKGDILYLLGKSGNKDVIPKLETVLKHPYPKDVIESAIEALETVKWT